MGTQAGICIADGCQEVESARGLCHMHYQSICVMRKKNGATWDDLVEAGVCLEAKLTRAKNKYCVEAMEKLKKLREYRGTMPPAVVGYNRAAQTEILNDLLEGKKREAEITEVENVGIERAIDALPDTQPDVQCKAEFDATGSAMNLPWLKVTTYEQLSDATEDE